MQAANVVFMNNYASDVNGGYYRADNVAQGQKIAEPPAPSREGYEFTGWYADPQCTIKWDFGQAPDIGEGERLTLYAGWQAQ